ncbi:hypothetical protein V8E51_011770 [Hyaloscypha variabilis]
MTTPATASKRKRTSEERPDAQAKNAKTLLPNFSQPTEMVTFLVGKDEERFSVHKEFACHYSPVLKAAFDSNFIEGQTQTYPLQDMLPSAFRLLAKWFYSDHIDLQLDIDPTVDINVTDEVDDNSDGEEDDHATLQLNEAYRAQDLNFAQLWVAGDRLLIPRLQNAVVLAWNQLWNCDDDDRVCTTSWLKYAYEHTTVGSPLRNIAVDKLVFEFRASDIKASADELPREILVDMAMVTANSICAIPPKSKYYQKEWADEYSEGDAGCLTDAKYRYRCMRNWRSYMVPENELS